MMVSLSHGLQAWRDRIKRADPRLSRLITAVALLLLIFVLLLFAGTLLWPVTTAIILVAGWEWSRLAAREEEREPRALIAGLFFVMLGYYFFGIASLILLPLFLPISLLLLRQSQQHDFIGLSCLSVLGVGFLGLYEHFGIVALGWTIVVVTAFDTAAFVGGKTMRGPKLCASISPDKRWSGFLCGLLVSSVCGTLWLMLTPSFFNPLFSLCASVLVGLATQVGDLSESQLKRRVGIKDTSSLLPGHGGVLDRIDGFLCAVPLSFLLLSLEGKLQLP